MHPFRLVLAILISMLFFSCDEEIVEQDLEVKNGLRVLVLGNSVLKHAPATELGWYADWGMAASIPEKDFVHVYDRLLQTSERFSYVDLSSKNIATWENNPNYDLNNYVDIASGTYDLVVLRLGENVRTTSGYAEALVKLVDFFRSEHTQVIITGLIWGDGDKESIHQEVARQEGYIYVSFDGFRKETKNYAFGQFQNPGVAGHPSDVGMQHIAELLLEATLESYSAASR